MGSPLGECVHAVRDEDVRLALAVAADEPVQAGRHYLLTPAITIMHTVQYSTVQYSTVKYSTVQPAQSPHS